MGTEVSVGSSYLTASHKRCIGSSRRRWSVRHKFVQTWCTSWKGPRVDCMNFISYSCSATAPAGCHWVVRLEEAQQNRKGHFRSLHRDMSSLLMHGASLLESLGTSWKMPHVGEQVHGWSVNAFVRRLASFSAWQNFVKTTNGFLSLIWLWLMTKFPEWTILLLSVSPGHEVNLEVWLRGGNWTRPSGSTATMVLGDIGNAVGSNFYEPSIVRTT